MAKMKLLYSPASPYARKVRAVAVHAGLLKNIDLVMAPLSPIAPNAEVDARNPVGKVPTLSADGMNLFDSAVICEYLDSKSRKPKLYPAKGKARWTALRLHAMGDGLLDAALLWRYENTLRPEALRWSDWSAGQMKKIVGVLDRLEKEAASLAGRATIGSLTVGCALGYLDFRFADFDWRKGRPKLAKWWAKFGELPAMAETRPTA
jgi:glutathione S-transferase